MPPVEARRDTAPADVCLVLEGTYPYVQGGVSTWVHDLIGSLPETRFALVHIGPEPGAYKRRRYALPANAVSLHDLYCRESTARGGEVAARLRSALAARHRHARLRGSSRVLHGIRRLHLEDTIDGSLLDDLAGGDLPVGAFLHGRAAFDLAMELYERLAPGAALVDFFWHFRSMHAPLVRLLEAPQPAADTYHAVCTGYAGLLAAIWSHRAGRPLLLTEHGLYARERKLELDRADWFRGPGRTVDDSTASALRAMWIRFFRILARCAYTRAATVVSLCEANRAKQIADGAPAERTVVVPNGIDLERLLGAYPARRVDPASTKRMRVGFVGRLVPIKDVVTFIRAVFLAQQGVELEAKVIGPIDEDRQYALRCRRLVTKLGLAHRVHFVDTLPLDRLYSEIDVLVLTSFSEAQPLVILEAGAAGIPVVASDVGACRELLEGGSDVDRGIGPSGIVTRLAAPEETAAAILRLARDPELRRAMAAAGQRRVAMFYRKNATIAAYRALYLEGSWQASAGVSSA